MLSNEQLLIVVWRQINFRSDQNAVAASMDRVVTSALDGSSFLQLLIKK